MPGSQSQKEKIPLHTTREPVPGFFYFFLVSSALFLIYKKERARWQLPADNAVPVRGLPDENINPG